MFEYPIGHIFSQKDDDYIVEIAQRNFMCDLCGFNKDSAKCYSYRCSNIRKDKNSTIFRALNVR